MTVQQSVFNRFLKGVLGGAVGAMILVSIQQPTVWHDFSLILNSLGMAAAYGSITGALLALQKLFSWQAE